LIFLFSTFQLFWSEFRPVKPPVDLHLIFEK
jgi:hypothetical protein